MAVVRWWRLKRGVYLNLSAVEAVCWDQVGVSRVHMASGKVHMVENATPRQVIASMNEALVHPQEDTDMARVIPDNVAELGHGARLEQRGGEIVLVRVDGTEAQVEGGVSQDKEALAKSLEKLGIYGGAPAGAMNWLLGGATDGEPATIAQVGANTMTQPFGAAAVGPMPHGAVKPQDLEGEPARAGVGDQTMTGSTLQPAEDKPAPEPEPAPAPRPAPPIASRTDNATQQTRGNTAQPKKR